MSIDGLGRNLSAETLLEEETPFTNSKQRLLFSELDLSDERRLLGIGSLSIPSGRLAPVRRIQSAPSDAPAPASNKRRLLGIGSLDIPSGRAAPAIIQRAPSDAPAPASKWNWILAELASYKSKGGALLNERSAPLLFSKWDLSNDKLGGISSVKSGTPDRESDNNNDLNKYKCCAIC